MSQSTHPLVELGRLLRARGYTFITGTPETHRRVNRHAQQQGHAEARDVRDVLGFSRPFRAGLLPAEIEQLLEAAGELHRDGELLRSNVRFSSLGELLLVHSAYPTQAPDAVFFGPDTYRFCRLLSQWGHRAERAADIGCGSGAGGLWLRGQAKQLVLCDVNQRALSYARVNAQLADVQAQVIESDVLSGARGTFDLIIANPPYMRDPSGRVYRDGGGAHGEALSVRIAREAIERLSPGGTLILYTGSAIVRGEDSFLRAVTPVLDAAKLRHSYEELDPDVFGEELDQPGYEDVERIAAVGLKVQR